MAIKMRVLYNSKKKGMAQMADVIRTEYDLPVNAVDGNFPPAYPCDKERIVILGISAKGTVADNFRLFCCELNKSRAANVALVVDGDQATADKVSEYIRSAGSNLVGTKIINLGGFGPFGGTLTNELRSELLIWVKDMVANCK